MIPIRKALGTLLGFGIVAVAPTLAIASTSGPTLSGEALSTTGLVALTAAGFIPAVVMIVRHGRS